jgi:hypothetical protein
MQGAILQGENSQGVDLTGAALPPWDSGQFEGVQLAGAAGWVAPHYFLSDMRDYASRKHAVAHVSLHLI